MEKQKQKASKEVEGLMERKRNLDAKMTENNSTQLNEHVRTQVLTHRCPHLFNTTTYETEAKGLERPGSKRIGEERDVEMERLVTERDLEAATIIGGVDSNADENSPERLRNRLIADHTTLAGRTRTTTDPRPLPVNGIQPTPTLASTW